MKVPLFASVTECIPAFYTQVLKLETSVLFLQTELFRSRKGYYSLFKQFVREFDTQIESQQCAYSKA